eukprot:COSAG02_NODE_892_length_16138_cov_14.599875_3_plen_144_part_00
MVSGYGLLLTNAISRCRCGSAQPLDCIIFPLISTLYNVGSMLAHRYSWFLSDLTGWLDGSTDGGNVIGIPQQRCFPVVAASPAIATTSSGRTVPMGIRLPYRPIQLFFYDRSLSLFLVVSLPSLFSRFLCDGVLTVCLHSVTS